MSIVYQYYPKNKPCPDHLLSIVYAFQLKDSVIASPAHNLKSNEVLDKVRVGLVKLGFQVESGKTDQIEVPVMYGLNGATEKGFRADAFSPLNRKPS